MRELNTLPKVSVVTITYGHENYIIETIKGVLMQKYSGEIEFIIANDNSPDKTHEVVEDFFRNNSVPSNFELKYTRHNTNKGMSANFIWAISQCSGKYIALCEGDDYWSDPHKIEMQVDYLDQNNDCVACGTYINLLKENFEENTSTLILREFGTNDLLRGEWIPTLTNMFRKSALHNAVSINVDDFSLLANLSCKGGKLVKLPVVSGVYRYHGNGVVSGQTLFQNRKRNFCSVYEFASKYKSKSFSKLMMVNLLRYFFIDELLKLHKADLKILVLCLRNYIRFWGIVNESR